MPTDKYVHCRVTPRPPVAGDPEAHKDDIMGGAGEETARKMRYDVGGFAFSCSKR